MAFLLFCATGNAEVVENVDIHSAVRAVLAVNGNALTAYGLFLMATMVRAEGQRCFFF